MTSYTHTQRGMAWVLIIGCGAPLVVLLVLYRSGELGTAGTVATILTMIFVCGLLWLMGSLTVTVADDMLSFHFGPGVIRKRIPIADITQVKTVRNPWYYGWGIRLTPHGWLYNVAGFDAVEVTRRGGSSLRLGTDEPGALHAANERARAARR